MTSSALVAGYFTYLMAAIGLCFLYCDLRAIPSEVWSRRCKWCFWAAIGVILAALGFPGWYFLFIVGV